MTTAITVRLDEEEHAALEEQAKQLGVRPGTLARILVHTGLTGAAPPRPGAADGRASLDRLVRRSKGWVPADAVALVADARPAARGARGRAARG
ncbi:MAG: hypothetical protein ACRD0L_09940 [Acidimicrobiales bacterium]